MLMDYDAKGMHMDLVCLSWQQPLPGTIPHDEIILRRWLHDPTEKVWNRVWPQIRRAWKIWGKNNELLYSRGVLREYRKIVSFSKKQAENAQKRWKRRRNTDHAMAMPPHHSGNARAGNALQSSSSPAGLPPNPLLPSATSTATPNGLKLKAGHDPWAVPESEAMTAEDLARIKASLRGPNERREGDSGAGGNEHV